MIIGAGVLLFAYTSFEFINGVNQVLDTELSKPKPAGWVKLSDIPRPIIEAILAAEGPGFLSCSANEALAQVFSEVRGALPESSDCTLPRLLIHNFGWPNFHNFTRRLDSLVASVLIFKKASNEQILEMVLNKTYFGKVGSKQVFGLKQAAQAYFSKPLNGLDLREAATLAGLIKSPMYYSPLKNSERAKERRDYVLNKMAELRLISSAQASREVNQPVQLKIKRK